MLFKRRDALAVAEQLFGLDATLHPALAEVRSLWVADEQAQQVTTQNKRVVKCKFDFSNESMCAKL